MFKKYCEFCKKELEFKNQQAFASNLFKALEFYAKVSWN
jgi:hypothetical protein